MRSKGAGSIIKLENNDTIEEPLNIDENANKILYIMSNHNNTRLLNNVERNKTSCESSSIMLKNYVNSIL